MNQLFPKLLLSISVIGLILTLASCKDDDKKPSKRAILIDKSWRTVKYEVNGQDLTEDQDECDLDNFMIFATDGTFVEDIGDVKCDESETDYDGTWKFKANESVITIDPSDDEPSDWNILELTSTSFRISAHPISQIEIVITMVPK